MAFSNKQLAALLFSDAGGGKRQCRLCGHHYARGDGYANLLAHLRGSHADYEARALEAAGRRQLRHHPAAQEAAAPVHEAPEVPATAATPGGRPGGEEEEEEEAKASEAAVLAAPTDASAADEGAADEHRRVEADYKRVVAAISTLGKRRRSAPKAISMPLPVTVEAAELSPPEKQRKLQQRSAAASTSPPPTAAVEAAAELSPHEKPRSMAPLPANMHEVYAMHSARKMELAHKKLRAELALQERRLSLEAARERNRTVLELVKLGKTPEEIEKLMPLFS